MNYKPIKILIFWSEVLTSESGPLSAPGQVNETYSWQRLWTTKLQTENEKKKLVVLQIKFIKIKLHRNNQEKISNHF